MKDIETGATAWSTPEVTELPTPEAKRILWFEKILTEVAAINSAAADFAGAQRPFVESAFGVGMARKNVVSEIVKGFAGEPMVLIPGPDDGTFMLWQSRISMGFGKFVPAGPRKLARKFAFNSAPRLRPDFETNRNFGEIFAGLAPEFAAYLERRKVAAAKKAAKAAAKAVLAAKKQAPVSAAPKSC
jgi:hypothetical protein